MYTFGVRSLQLCQFIPVLWSNHASSSDSLWEPWSHVTKIWIKKDSSELTDKCQCIRFAFRVVTVRDTFVASLMCTLIFFNCFHLPCFHLLFLDLQDVPKLSYFLTICPNNSGEKLLLITRLFDDGGIGYFLCPRYIQHSPRTKHLKTTNACFALGFIIMTFSCILKTPRRVPEVVCSVTQIGWNLSVITLLRTIHI